jgi:hypothetical protein
MDIGSGASTSEGPLPRLAVKIEDAAVVTGTTRSRIYGAIRDKQLTARKAGKSTIVLIDDLEAWLKTLPTVGKPPEMGAAA